MTYPIEKRGMAVRTWTLILLSLLFGCRASEHSTVEAESAPEEVTYAEMVRDLAVKHNADISYLQVFAQRGDSDRVLSFEVQDVFDNLAGQRLLIVGDVYDIYRREGAYWAYVLSGPIGTIELQISREAALDIASTIHRRHREAWHYFAFVVVPQEVRHEFFASMDDSESYVVLPTLSIRGECAEYEVLEEDVKGLELDAHWDGLSL